MYARGTPPTRSASPFARLLAKAKQEGRPDTHFGQRRRPRFALGAVLAATTRVGGAEGVWSVTMRNISDGGVAVRSRRAVAKGATLFLCELERNNAAGLWVEAEAVHCTPIGDGYLIGLKFRDEPA